MEKEKLKGDGVPKGETRVLPPFHGLSVSCHCSVLLEKGREQSLSIEGDQNLLPHIKTDVSKDGALVVSSDVCFRSMMGIRIRLMMTDVTTLSLSGAAKSRNETSFETDFLNLFVNGSGKMNLKIKAKTITTTIAGSGKIDIEGEAENCQLIVSGSGKYDASELSAAEYQVTIKGSGKCRIKVLEKLHAAISGSGKLYYKGNPQVLQSNISGSGRIEKL